LLIDRADFVDLAELAAHRQAGWERQREYVATRSALHRRVWGRAEPPRRLEGLAELPLVDKEMLRASQRAHPPFGDYLAAPVDKIARIHRTSGTTGTAMNLALSARDAQETAIVGARAQAASGLGPGIGSCIASTTGCGWAAIPTMRRWRRRVLQSCRSGSATPSC
jgi:phenylacetate-CoA ligase